MRRIKVLYEMMRQPLLLSKNTGHVSFFVWTQRVHSVELSDELSLSVRIARTLSLDLDVRMPHYWKNTPLQCEATLRSFLVGLAPKAILSE